MGGIKDNNDRGFAGDWLRRAPGLAPGAQPGPGPGFSPGIERVEAFFRGAAYGVHRHDSYAIGVTMAGVQTFRYRSALRHSVAGHAVVLHPDEPHDGQAGTDAGFHYRIAYVAPDLLQEVLGGAPLPFIDGGVSSDRRLVRAARALLADFDGAADGLAQQDALFDLAGALRQAAPSVPGRSPASVRGGDFRAVRLARDYILDTLHGVLPHRLGHCPAGRPALLTLDELARVSGRDRWSLSRDFRLYLGTSPHRYVTMRRLALARTMLVLGRPLAEAALHSGFADQSHLTRHFVAAFGMAPGRWLRLYSRSG